MVESMRIDVPEDIRDLASFRDWALTTEFPQGTHISYFGDIWIDLSREQIFSHNQVKLAISTTLDLLSRESQSGRFFPTVSAFPACPRSSPPIRTGCMSQAKALDQAAWC